MAVAQSNLNLMYSLHYREVILKFLLCCHSCYRHSCYGAKGNRNDVMVTGMTKEGCVRIEDTRNLSKHVLNTNCFCRAVPIHRGELSNISNNPSLQSSLLRALSNMDHLL